MTDTYPIHFFRAQLDRGIPLDTCSECGMNATEEIHDVEGVPCVHDGLRIWEHDEGWYCPDDEEGTMSFCVDRECKGAGMYVLESGTGGTE